MIGLAKKQLPQKKSHINMHWSSFFVKNVISFSPEKHGALT
jgi:hypothetical protein